MAMRRGRSDPARALAVALSGFKDGFTGFTEAIGKAQEARAEEAKEVRQHQRKLEEIIATAKAKQDFPSAEETRERFVNQLIARQIQKEPTQAQAREAIPERLRVRVGQPGFAAVPGPEGGVVVPGRGGRAEVAPGGPSTMDTLTERIGFPRARQELETQRGEAADLLGVLSRAGLAGRAGAAEFPATATQREQVAAAESRQDAIQSVLNGEMDLETALDALLEAHPQLDRSTVRQKLLIESTTARQRRR